MSDIKELKINFLKVLADQTRLDILTLIKHEERTQDDLVKLLKKSQSTISQHLNLLLMNNLIVFVKKENKKYYHIKDNEVYDILTNINNYIIKNNEDKITDAEKVLWDI